MSHNMPNPVRSFPAHTHFPLLPRFGENVGTILGAYREIQVADIPVSTITFLLFSNRLRFR